MDTMTYRQTRPEQIGGYGWWVPLTISLALLFSTAHLAAAQWVIKTVDVPLSWGTDTRITGLTELGKLSATYLDLQGVERGATYVPSTRMYTKLMQRGWPQLRPDDLLGNLTTIGHTSTGQVFVRNSSGSMFRLLNSHWLGCSFADETVAVCVVETPTGHEGIFVDWRTNTALSAIAHPDAPFLFVQSANRHYDVVGFVSEDGDMDRGFRLRQATPTVLERFTAPCGGNTTMWDINDHGLMAATCDRDDPVSGETLEFLSYLTDGVTWTPFMVPGSVWTAATHVNNAGQVAGSYGTADWQEHGFIATPTP